MNAEVLSSMNLLFHRGTYKGVDLSWKFANDKISASIIMSEKLCELLMNLASLGLKYLPEPLNLVASQKFNLFAIFSGPTVTETWVW